MKIITSSIFIFFTLTGAPASANPSTSSFEFISDASLSKILAKNRDSPLLKNQEITPIKAIRWKADSKSALLILARNNPEFSAGECIVLAEGIQGLKIIGSSEDLHECKWSKSSPKFLRRAGHLFFELPNAVDITGDQAEPTESNISLFFHKSSGSFCMDDGVPYGRLSCKKY